MFNDPLSFLEHVAVCQGEGSASFSKFTNCCVANEFSDGEMVECLRERKPNKNGFDFLYLMEECGLYTDCNSYFWLLEGCLKYGSLADAKRVHGRILKSGFGGDSGLANRLVDAFIGFGNLDDAIRVVNEMSQRNVTSWNYILAAFLAKKMNHRVLGFFRRMLECTQLDGHAFACDLRACDGSNASFSCIEQIHAQIFRRGFFTEPIISNALIYLYSKYGDVDSAALVFGELC
ncbi:hypothetical protein AAC387_Pa07g2625 [Persea americana]